MLGVDSSAPAGGWAAAAWAYATESQPLPLPPLTSWVASGRRASPWLTIAGVTGVATRTASGVAAGVTEVASTVFASLSGSHKRSGAIPDDLRGLAVAEFAPTATAVRLLQAAPGGNTSANGNSSSSTTTVAVEEDYQIRNGPLETMWKAVYWSTFFLTYIFIPVVQEFIAAGDFTACGRLRTAVRVNVVFYLAVGVLGVAALAYVLIAYGLALGELLAMVISLANTYGLVLVVLLMGYGAAEVPKALWRTVFPTAALARLRFTAPEAEARLFDARTHLGEVLVRIRALDREVSAAAAAAAAQPAEAREWAEATRCRDVVLTDAAAELAAGIGAVGGRSSLAAADAEAKLASAAAKGRWSAAKLLITKLAAARKALRAARLRVLRYAYRWRAHVSAAADVEAVLARQLPPRVARASGVAGALARARWAAGWAVGPPVYAALAIAAEVLSLLLMWSEATIWINLSGLASTNLSVFGQLLVAVSDSAHSYFTIQVVAALPLAWMCVCSTYAIFRLKVGDILDLAPHHTTDPYALCINAALFNRLQFSLAFNYLNVLMHSRNKSDFPDTAFSHSVGAGLKLSVVDWYLPVLMPVLYAMARANLWTRFLRLFGVDQAGDPVRGNLEHDELIEEGAALIAKARKALGVDGGAVGGTDEGAGAGAQAEVVVSGGGGGGGSTTSFDDGSGRPSQRSMMSLDAFSGPPGVAAAGGSGGNGSPASSNSADSANSGTALKGTGGGGSGSAAPSFFAALAATGSGMGLPAALTSFGFGGEMAGRAGAPATGNGGGGRSNGSASARTDADFFANPWGAPPPPPVGLASQAASRRAVEFAPTDISAARAGAGAAHGSGRPPAAPPTTGLVGLRTPTASLADFAETGSPGSGGKSLADLLRGGAKAPPITPRKL